MGIGDTLFRNHDALSVVAANLQPWQQTPEVPTVNEHRNIVSFEQRGHDRDFGFRLWRQHSNESHDV